MSNHINQSEKAESRFTPPPIPDEAFQMSIGYILQQINRSCIQSIKEGDTGYTEQLVEIATSLERALESMILSNPRKNWIRPTEADPGFYWHYSRNRIGCEVIRVVDWTEVDNSAPPHHGCTTMALFCGRAREPVGTVFLDGNDDMLYPVDDPPPPPEKPHRPPQR